MVQYQQSPAIGPTAHYGVQRAEQVIHAVTTLCERARSVVAALRKSAEAAEPLPFERRQPWHGAFY